MEKNCVFSLFSSLSLSISFFLCTRSLGSFEFNQFHSTIDKPSLVITGWLIRGLSYQ